MTLFRLGRFTSHSGLVLDWKIECDDLTPEDLECLASIGYELIGDFGHVVYIPDGGARFAQAMQQWCSPESPRVLLVDDVLTTGRSMERFRDRMILHPSHRPKQDVLGLVIFARTIPPPWIRAIFTLTEGVR